MNHKSIACVLKIAGGIALAGILTIFYFYVPVQALLSPKETAGTGCCTAFLMLLGLPYLFALGYYFAVCGKIAANRSFCRENVRSMRRIAQLMCVSAVGWLCAAVALFAMNNGAEIFNALIAIAGVSPIFIRALSLLVCAASLAVSMVAKMLSVLLNRAADLQADSDLTI